MKIEGLDELDNQILELLREHARMTYSEIGAQVGLSRVAVKNRMDRLEQQGVILGYRTEIASRNVEDIIQFFMDVETEPAEYQQVLDTLGSNRMLHQIYAVSGSCRLRAVGYAENPRILQSYANGLFKNMKGVKKISVYTVLSTLKDTDGGLEYGEYQES